MGRITLRQDLRVLDVSTGGRSLTVVLAAPGGGRSQIRFEYGDDRSVSNHLTTIRRWMHRRTPLTHVRHGATSALIDDRARFEAAFGV